MSSRNFCGLEKILFGVLSLVASLPGLIRIRANRYARLRMRSTLKFWPKSCSTGDTCFEKISLGYDTTAIKWKRKCTCLCLRRIRVWAECRPAVMPPFGQARIFGKIFLRLSRRIASHRFLWKSENGARAREKFDSRMRRGAARRGASFFHFSSAATPSAGYISHGPRSPRTYSRTRAYCDCGLWLERVSTVKGKQRLLDECGCPLVQ